MRARPSSALLGAMGAGCVLASILGCGDSRLPPTESERGEHLVYAWEPTLTPCGGTVSAMDRYIPFVADQLGKDVAGLDPITYTWLTKDEFLARRPDVDIPGTGYCHGSDAVGDTPAILHELVHAVDSPARGGRRFFIEGLAGAFHPRTGGRRYSGADPRPYLATSYDDDVSEVQAMYDAGAGFVAYLISRHSAARFLELHDRLGPTATEGRIRRVFADVYGAEFDAEVEAYLGGGCPEDAGESPQIYACSGEEVPWASAMTWFDARELACDDPGTIGGVGDASSSASVWVTLEVAEAGAYEVRAFGDREVRVTLASCGRCPWLAVDAHLRHTAGVVTLTPGRWAVIYSGEARAVSVVGAQIVRTPEHDGDAAGP